MPETISFAGKADHKIPSGDKQETGWGQDLTIFLTAVAKHALTKNTASLPLEQLLDFGENAGIKVKELLLKDAPTGQSIKYDPDAKVLKFGDSKFLSASDLGEVIERITRKILGKTVIIDKENTLASYFTGDSPRKAQAGSKFIIRANQTLETPIVVELPDITFQCEGSARIIQDSSFSAVDVAGTKYKTLFYLKNLNTKMVDCRFEISIDELSGIAVADPGFDNQNKPMLYVNDALVEGVDTNYFWNTENNRILTGFIYGQNGLQIPGADE